MKTAVSLLAALAMMALVACSSTKPETTGKPAKPTGTPPPSASTIPPPLPPGHTPGPAGMR